MKIPRKKSTNLTHITIHHRQKSQEFYHKRHKYCERALNQYCLTVLPQTYPTIAFFLLYTKYAQTDRQDTLSGTQFGGNICGPCQVQAQN